MKFLQTSIPGLLRIEPFVADDPRGRFVKTFHQSTFAEQQLPLQFAEEYYSTSGPGVIRGMHFQLPPHDHYKLVVCLAGGVLDVVLDLRRGSPAYGKFESFELTGRSPQLLLIPPGLAHGFCVTEAPATMYYKVTTAYSPAHDSGVRWNSIGFEWPVNDPLVSARDAALPALADFQSPFVYSPGI